MAPATFLVFVVLALDGCDVRREPLHLRRRQLEGMATAWTPPLQLTPQTGDEGEARRWLEEYGATDLSAWKDWWPRLLSLTKPAIAGG